MSTSKKDVKTALTSAADRLDKLSKDILFHAEEASVGGLKALKGKIAAAEAGKTSFVEASVAAKAMADDMAENIARMEQDFILEEHEAERDRMIEALLSLRGQARATGAALSHHLLLDEEENDAPVEIKLS